MGYSITYEKPTCQTKIHSEQEKMEGMHIRVSAKGDACACAKSIYARRWLLVDKDTSIDA